MLLHCGTFLRSSGSRPRSQVWTRPLLSLPAVGPGSRVGAGYPSLLAAHSSLAGSQVGGEEPLWGESRRLSLVVSARLTPGSLCKAADTQRFTPGNGKACHLASGNIRRQGETLMAGTDSGPRPLS